MSTKKVTVDVPLALQQLIKANNALLKTYQTQMMTEIQEANVQIMQLLQINPSDGWRLDMENMVYVRIEETPIENASVTG